MITGRQVMYLAKTEEIKTEFKYIKQVMLLRFRQVRISSPVPVIANKIMLKVMDQHSSWA